MGTFQRWSGGCLAAAGLLVLPSIVHPDIFEAGFAEPSLHWFWAVGHTAGLLVVTLSLFGLAGVAALHGPRLGRLGVVGVVLAVPGLVVTAGAMAIEGLVFPALARADPALLDLDGPVAGSTALRAVGAVGLLGLVGLVLVGVAVERAGVLPRGPGALLAAGAAALAAFEGPFVPVLGQASVVVFAAAHVWVGVAVARTAAGAGFARRPQRGGLPANRRSTPAEGRSPLP
jgi:hypothetical protein